jgi:hypothetical protein
MHLFIPLTNTTERIPVQFVNETQLTFVVPDMSNILKFSIADAWVIIDILSSLIYDSDFAVAQ